MRENAYQTKLRKRIERRFPGCFILKNDPNLLQGIPDLTILWGRFWAILEVKASRPTEDDFEPNQEWYIEHFDQMSFAACIFPEIEEEVLDAMERSFGVRRSARASKR